MGTENATPLFAVPNTNWVNATFLWLTSKRPISRVTAKRSTQPNPAPGAVCVLIHAVRGEFPASREVLSVTHPEQLGSNEVKQQ
jgi:hypothetical protein